MEDDCVCDYDSTWDTESDGDDPAGDNQNRRPNPDKNKSSWALVRAFIITQPHREEQKYPRMLTCSSLLLRPVLHLLLPLMES